MPAPPPSRLLDELKRRNVFRAAGVYGATAFVVIQAADVIFPRIPLPEWTVSLVVWLSLLGFPFAVALAWVYERTDGGLRRTPAPDSHRGASPGRRWTATVGALAGVGLLVAGGWSATRGPLAGSRSYESIAVLPFEDLSGAADNAYFGQGLAEELLNALAGIEGLKVAARTSAFSFQGRKVGVDEIAERLGVETVLEGSIRRSASALRINAQLVDARTGFRLWSQDYDRPLRDIFAVQEEIAREIVDALAIRLRGETPETLYLGGTDDVAAYDHYLHGRQLWATRRLDALPEALASFEAAIARDSAFALAWSGKADAIDALAWRDTAWLDRLPEARYAAQRAVALEPRLAEGWASLGVLALDFDRDWRMAELALRRATELKPAYATAHQWLADGYRYSGRVRAALAPARRAAELDPLRGLAYDGLGRTAAILGDWATARSAFTTMVAGDESAAGMALLSYGRELGLAPDEIAGYAARWARAMQWPDPEEARVIGLAVLDSTRRDEALALLDRMEAGGVSARDLTVITVAIGAHEAGIRRLEAAVEAGWDASIILGTDPALDPIRSDPRVARAMAALGVPNGYDPATDPGPYPK